MSMCTLAHVHGGGARAACQVADVRGLVGQDTHQAQWACSALVDSLDQTLLRRAGVVDEDAAPAQRPITRSIIPRAGSDAQPAPGDGAIMDAHQFALCCVRDFCALRYFNYDHAVPQLAPHALQCSVAMLPRKLCDQGEVVVCRFSFARIRFCRCTAMAAHGHRRIHHERR